METNTNYALTAIEQGLRTCQGFIRSLELEAVQLTSWVQDSTTKLYHYYELEPELVAQAPLCEGPVLLTGTVRRKGGPLPDGLKPRYTNNNLSAIGRQAGICKACSLRLQEQERSAKRKN